MNTGRISLLVVGLILALLLGGVFYFSRPVSTPVLPVPSGQMAGQTRTLNPTPEIASPAQPSDTTPPPQVSSIPTPTYRYNAQGQLQVIIYPDGSIYSYQYSSQGDKIRETGRTGRTWSYAYDQNHHPLSVIDPAGRVTHTAPPAAAPNAP